MAAPPRLNQGCRNALVAVLLTMVTYVTAASAQATLNPTGQRATRADLTARLTLVKQQLASSSVKKDAKASLEGEATTLSTRLTEGDFRVGDRIVVIITQDDVKTDSVAVRDSLKVSLGAFPDYSLYGVLRSELDAKLGEFVARYLRNSRVRAVALSRISVLGAVGRPGFYYALPDRPLSELVAQAGGPSGDANAGEMEVKRGSNVLVSRKQSKLVLNEGRTLEQLDIQSGDEVFVPIKRKIPWQQIIQFAFLGMSLMFGVIQFLQYYYSRKNQ